MLTWVRRYPGNLRSVMVHGALVCALAHLLSWGVALLPLAAGRVALTLLAAVGSCAPCFLKAEPGVAEALFENGGTGGASCGAAVPAAGGALAAETPADSGPALPSGFDAFVRALRDLLSIIWLPLVGFLVFTFTTNAYEFPVDPHSMGTETTGALLASALALAVGLPRRGSSLVALIDRLVIPLCAAFCIVCASFPVDTPVFLMGAATVFAPLIFMAIYAISSFVVVSKAGEFPAAFVFGVALFTGAVVSVASATISHAFPNSMNLGEVTGVVVSCYWALVIAKLALGAWRRDVGGKGEGAGDAGAQGSQVDETSVDALVAARLEALSAAHSLTPREVEILGFLGRGHSSTYIANELMISANTVRTHTYNLYKKLGISTREELLELVQGKR